MINRTTFHVFLFFYFLTVLMFLYEGDYTDAAILMAAILIVFEPIYQHVE